MIIIVVRQWVAQMYDCCIFFSRKLSGDTKNLIWVWIDRFRWNSWSIFVPLNFQPTNYTTFSNKEITKHHGFNSRYVDLNCLNANILTPFIRYTIEIKWENCLSLRMFGFTLRCNRSSKCKHKNVDCRFMTYLNDCFGFFLLRK